MIKDMEGDFCPHMIHLKYNLNCRTEPTEAMENGLFFESELLGSARGGKFELPKNKQGKPYKRELDILENVKYAKSIFQKHNVKIQEVQPYYERNNAAGHLDAIANIGIIDVKWTGMAKDKFIRELQYGMIESYEIQARQYQYIYPADFYFYIFGKSNWCKIIKFPYDEQKVKEHYENNIHPTELKLKSIDTFEIEPSYDQCEGCRVKDFCKHDKKQDTPPIENYELYKRD